MNGARVSIAKEVVWSVNIMIAILIIGVAWVLYYIFTYDQKFTS